MLLFALRHPGILYNLDMPLPLELAQRRYAQQASWTRPLRQYLLEQAGVAKARRVLEVGCGTGAILSELAAAEVHGLDIDREALLQAAQAAPGATLTSGDAHKLPYEAYSFDIVCFHFVLLWLGDPVAALAEAARVARLGGAVLAFAEPDYTQRTNDATLERIGDVQTAALRRQGADPGIGGQLPELFRAAGLTVIENGPLESVSRGFDDLELEVLRSDLGSEVPEAEWQSIAKLASHPEVRFAVPTFFAWATVS